MHVHIGCSIEYTYPQPTPMLFVLRPSFTSSLSLVEERRTLSPDVPIDTYIDGYGNQVWRVVAPLDRLQIEYNALVALAPTPDLSFPDLRKTAVENLPYDVIVYMLPSRLCPSDLFVNDAWDLFGQIQGGWAQVQAVCDWLHGSIRYAVGSTSSTSAWDAYQRRRGVCRDFAHLGVAFCRALNFPARYVCGYMPNIDVPYDPAPMDFHAWFEVYIDGLWCTFDARHNFPRIGRVPIARGRDAVDVAFSTTYGSTQLVSMKVWADQVNELLSLSVMLLKNNY